MRREGRFVRLYAVKRLHAQYRGDDDFLSMFLDEARVAGLVRHPNVVSVLDVGQDDEGPYLVMEFVEGVSVEALIRRTVVRNEMIPMQVALRIAVQIARGLHAAHELRDASGQPLGLVHRDVSPQNVLVGYDGISRVTDFGVAKAFGRVTKTSTGVLKGKLGYMAPEVLRFEEPDRRADLFSFGVVLHELLVGRRLYKNREGMDGARRILKEPPPDLADDREDASPQLVELLFSTLAKDPKHRPDTALAIAQSLEGVLAEVLLDEPPIEVSEYLRRVFAEEREEHRERVQCAIEDAESREFEAAIDITLENLLDLDPEQTEVTEQMPPTRMRWWIPLGIAAAAAAALAWTQLTTPPNEPLEVGAPSAVVTGAENRPVPAATEVTQVTADVDDVPAMAAQVDPGSEPPAIDPEPADPEPADPTRHAENVVSEAVEVAEVPRARTRPRRPVNRTQGRGSRMTKRTTPMWEW